ncbi:MAG: hypothetical protein CBE48_000705 [Flavobacteriales bacterium TMED288]|nr:hypothetical protein [Flavobacteriales bacterium]RPG53693.1 MAG: hypothetical protein CBE48_000705 [Flavobacteriales bacterium TMED288]
MKQFYIYIFFTLIFVDASAQNCDAIIPNIFSSSSSETIILDENNIIDSVYFDLCIGEELILEGNYEVVSENPQSDLYFKWYLDGIVVSSSNSFSQVFNNSGGYVISLEITDNFGCIYSTFCFIRVSFQPEVNLNFTPDLNICPGTFTTISTSDENSDILFSSDISTGNWSSPPCEDEFAEPLYLPDGSGAVYETSIILTCFGEGQALTNINDILSVDINMEHSYTGDLDIYLTAPNGIQVTLFEQDGGSTWFGEATDQDASETNPGIGYDYGWSMNPSYNGTMSDGMDDNTVPQPDGFGNILNQDTYLPIGNFQDFLGTSLNGTWTITVIDNLSIDNGWIFSWGISINQNIIPSAWSFNNYITEENFILDSTITDFNDSTIIVFNEPGTHEYIYNVIDNFGCSYTSSHSASISDYIESNYTFENEYCGGNDGEIILNPSGGFSPNNFFVEWSNGSNNTIISNLSQGNYSFIISDEVGCKLQNSIFISNEILGLEFDITVNDDHCNQGIGDANLINLNGDPPYTFSWSHSNLNSSTTNNLYQGNYSIEVIDYFGCYGNKEFEVINISGPNSFFENNFDTVVFNNGTIEFLNLSSSIEEIISFDWSFGDGNFSNIENPKNNFDQIGEYLVQLTVNDQFNCSDTYSRIINSVEDYFIWSPNIFTPDNNGLNETFRPILKNFDESSFSIKIYNRWGKIVYISKDYHSGWNGKIANTNILSENGGYSYSVSFKTFGNKTENLFGSFILMR